LHPIDVALEPLEKLKSGLSKMECAVCMYKEFEYSEDPYNSRVHPFKHVRNEGKVCPLQMFAACIHIYPSFWITEMKRTHLKVTVYLQWYVY